MSLVHKLPSEKILDTLLLMIHKLSGGLMGGERLFADDGSRKLLELEDQLPEVDAAIQEIVLPWWRNAETVTNVDILTRIMRYRGVASVAISEMIEYPFDRELRERLLQPDQLRQDPHNLIQSWYGQYYLEADKAEVLKLELDSGRATNLLPDTRAVGVRTDLFADMQLPLKITDIHHPKVVLDFTCDIQNGTINRIIQSWIQDLQEK